MVLGADALQNEGSRSSFNFLAIRLVQADLLLYQETAPDFLFVDVAKWYFYV